MLSGSELAAFRDLKTIYKYPSLKVQGEALANVVMRARIDCYSELAKMIKLDDLLDSTVKKSIIFSNYTEICNSVVESVTDSGYKPITVYGDTTKDLTRNVNMFTNDPKINPLVSTYKSLSTGVPLIISNVIIMFGLPYRQYIYEQSIGRAWRTGQDKPVYVYIMELDTGGDINISDRDFDIISYYADVVESITGSSSGAKIIRDDAGLMANAVDMNTDMIELINSESYVSKLVNKVKDVVDSW